MGYWMRVARVMVRGWAVEEQAKASQYGDLSTTAQKRASGRDDSWGGVEESGERLGGVGGASVQPLAAGLEGGLQTAERANWKAFPQSCYSGCVTISLIFRAIEDFIRDHNKFAGIPGVCLAFTMENECCQRLH
jgi:hypothetical protein